MVPLQDEDDILDKETKKRLKKLLNLRNIALTILLPLLIAIFFIAMLLTLSRASEVDLLNDPYNCGSIGRVCSLAHSQPKCESGSCVLGTCDDQWQDYDKKIYTGCEQFFPNLKKGFVLITEIMPKPFSSKKKEGQFVELYNTTQYNLNLKDLVVQMGDPTSDKRTVTIDKDIFFPPYTYVLLATSVGTNVFDYVDAILEVRLKSAEDTIRIFYKNVEVDSVFYNKLSYAHGVSVQLDKSHYSADENDLAENWCLSTTQFFNEDLGTPRQDNSICN